MYLSRLEFPLADKESQELLANPHLLHRALMSCFPTPAGRPLYRIEPTRDGQDEPMAIVLVQSGERPDWSRLLSHPRAHVKEFAPQFQTGHRFRFRLRANPTVKRKRDGQENGAREGIIGEDRQREWLARKGLVSGFAVESCITIDEHTVTAHRPASGTLSFRSVRFEGALRVTDPGRFEKTLAAGIGSGKAFGFGLLSLART